MLGHLRRYEQALEYLNKALEQNPNDISVIHDRKRKVSFLFLVIHSFCCIGGRIFESLGRSEEALADYHRSLLFPPKEEKHFGAIASSYYKVGKYSDVRRESERQNRKNNGKRLTSSLF